MARLGTTGCVLKWIATFGVLLVLAAWLYSTRRAVFWTSPSLRHEIGLMVGAVNYSRYSDDWLRNTSSPPRAGWSVAFYFDPPPLEWWPVGYSVRHASSIAIPLWIAFVAIGGVAGILWYADRACFGAAKRRWGDRLRPKRRKRVAVWVIGAFTLAHVVLAVFALIKGIALYEFFFPRAFGQVNAADRVEAWLVPSVIWAAPLWGILWAWLFVRLRNRLLVAQAGSRCLECGYDLTGNVSGRCSECGAAVPASEAVRGR